jgi:predicted ATPase/class 3 adenylate cyclase
VTDKTQIEQAIAALEGQRGILGGEVVDPAIAALKEKLATLSPPALSQQRKLITVLFADVSGFSTLAEMVDAEEVNEIINNLWQRLDGIITRHGGKVDKHIGDAVMAIWGSAVVQEDDPEQAIRAALAMQEAVAGVVYQVERNGRLPQTAEAEAHDGSWRPTLRIGINTGDALLGQVGTTGEYTAMGSAVNIASHLERAAPVGGILISHHCYLHVRGIFILQPVEPMIIKGMSEPVETYTVEGARPREFRVTTRGVEGLETRMIGRQAELALLQTTLYEVVNLKQLRLVTIVGEAGLGKSRLLYEFDNWLDLVPEEIVFFKGRADSQLRHTPFYLFRSVFAFRFQILDNDSPETVRRKFEEGFARFLGPDGVKKSHFVGQLLGFDFSQSYAIKNAQDARFIYEQGYQALEDFFRGVSVGDPAVLMLEDIHWADANSLDLIEHLVQHGQEIRFFIIALTRPTLYEHRPDWARSLDVHRRLALRALSRSDSRQLVLEILRHVPQVPHVLEETVISSAEGNPFYVEEIIKMMIENGVIAKGEKVWHVIPERLVETRIPSTLTGVLQARLDRLPGEEREILQRASVVGRTFWDQVCIYLGRETNGRHAGDEPAAAVSTEIEHIFELLETLREREFIYRRESATFAGTREYAFKHALLHEVIYESVLRSRRRLYHRQTAEWLIEHSGRRVEEYAGLIAGHYEQAGQGTTAAGWYSRAGKQAQETYVTDIALSYYQKALSLFEQSQKVIPAAEMLPVYLGLGTILREKAQFAEALDYFKQMLETAETAGSLADQAEALNGMARVYERLGDYQAALYSAEEMGACVERMEAQDTVLLSRAVFRKGWILYRMGEATQALELARRSLILSAEIDDQKGLAQSLSFLGSIYVVLGQFAEAFAALEEALAIDRLSGDPRRIAVRLNNLGETARLQGDYKRAVVLLQEAITVVRQIGNLGGEMVYLSNLAGARIGLGQYAAAIADLQRVIQTVDSDWFLSYEIQRFLAQAYLGLNREKDALTAAHKALALSLASGDQNGIGKTWQVLGEIGSRFGRPVEVPAEMTAEGGEMRLVRAADCFEESVAIFSKFDMRPSRARVLWRWAQHELERGNFDKGKAMWQEAREIFEQLNLVHWLAQMEGKKR